MKKVLFFLIVILVLGMIPAMAADLQAGWYANPLGLDFFQFVNPETEIHVGYARFLLDPGYYGPFAVQALDTRARTVSVPTTVYGVSADQSLILPTEIQVAEYYDLSQVSRFRIHWSTNYDSSQMLLELWGRTSSDQEFTRYFRQTVFGPYESTQIFAGGDFTDASFFFRVAVIPEPGSLACCVSLFGLAAALVRRKGS